MECFQVHAETGETTHMDLELYMPPRRQTVHGLRKGVGFKSVTELRLNLNINTDKMNLYTK